MRFYKARIKVLEDALKYYAAKTEDHATAQQALSETHFCSFCGEFKSKCKFVITTDNPDTCICDKCVALCLDVVAQEMSKLPKPNEEQLAKMEAKKRANTTDK